MVSHPYCLGNPHSSHPIRWMTHQRGGGEGGRHSSVETVGVASNTSVRLKWNRWRVCERSRRFAIESTAIVNVLADRWQPAGGPLT